jgi:hypothetical protein
LRERKSFCRSYPPWGRPWPFRPSHPCWWCVMWTSLAWFRSNPGFALETIAIVHVSHTKISKEQTWANHHDPGGPYVASRGTNFF